MIKDGIMMSAIKRLHHHPQQSYKDTLSSKYILSFSPQQRKGGHPPFGDSYR